MLASIDCLLFLEITLATHSYILLQESHSKNGLHGLACNPVIHDQFITGGDDGLLKLWSFELNTCIKQVNLNYAIRSLCWNNEGTKIIVGLGGDKDLATKDGKFGRFML